MIPLGYLLFFLPVLVSANSNGHCVMRGNCELDDMTYLNRPCVYNGAPVPLTDPSAMNILNDLCPNLVKGSGREVCCDANQLNTFNDQLQALGSLFKRCPSCFHNLANLFCQQVCSPNQSLFMEVTASTNNSVDGIDYYITESYTTGLFDSCKNVKLAGTTSRAIEISCGAHSTDCTPHIWLEYMGGQDPSPYEINFHFEKTNNVIVKDKTFYPMNETIIPCSEAVNEFGSPCSCVDCPCSTTPPPPPPTSSPLPSQPSPSSLPPPQPPTSSPLPPQPSPSSLPPPQPPTSSPPTPQPPTSSLSPTPLSNSSPPPSSTPPPLPEPEKKFLSLPLLVGVMALVCVVIVVIAIIIGVFAYRKGYQRGVNKVATNTMALL